VNLFKQAKKSFTFLLGNEEREAFVQILQQYPRLPEAHLRVTRNAQLPKGDEMQRLLSEALAEQRAENRKGVQQFLNATDRFEPTDRGWLLTISTIELDWLLQILNDVRVGSWVGLGAPEPKVEIRKVEENTIRDFWDMEIAGHFQCALLGALNEQTARQEAKEAAKVCSLKCFGTADGWPSPDRNHSSFLYRFGKIRLLVDCGEGISRSYKASGLSYDAVDALFLSHMHADHVGGFLMLMQSLWLEKRRKALPVYMPGGAIRPMKEMLKTALIYDGLLRFQMRMLALKENVKNVVKTVRVTAFPTTHLAGLRKKFSKASASRFSAFCFLLEHKKLRIGHSADLGRPEDLDPLFAKPLDVLVCELAHFTPEKIFNYLQGKPVKRLIFIHVNSSPTHPYRSQLGEIRKMAKAALPKVEVLFPDDGDEIVF
jgi:ribonuclease BN (tRNA processing enzyme)